ncbi:MAG TPA: FecR domain-containing protein [Chitinophaga sp.]|uniref:FecR family protein n=1 Tax=Chitinophaga sp. TaxID=1869181 RepID=UPI002BAE25CA|nr:FecR domain-containing protein [Chitinophaga sp.]HVI47503.1 FecR domain-containing protein [Chitinophaga sp.]
MLTDNSRLHYLINQYLNQTITPEERAELSGFLNAPDNHAQLELLIEEAWVKTADEQIVPFTHQSDQMLEQIMTRIDPPSRKGYWQRWAAAILLLAAGGLSWLIFQGDKKTRRAPLVATSNRKDAAPGSTKATLTLGDGDVIELDSSGKIPLAKHQLNMQLSAGQLAYNNETTATISWHTLSTPRGGQFRLVLPDGSKVWLNAASSLKFPTAFTGKERKVELNGEAYFEVEKNPGQPFHVTIKDADVAVLGTSFNIMAYTDENAIKTTLLEGAVKVSKEQEATLLKPGEQSLLDAAGKIHVIENADVDLAVAWKNGLTSFRSADIKTIMRQVERWYDVEVVYNGAMPARTFTGDIPRNANLSELLRLLEVSRIHFKMEDNRLIVMP